MSDFLKSVSAGASPQALMGSLQRSTDPLAEFKGKKGEENEKRGVGGTSPGLEK